MEGDIKKKEGQTLLSGLEEARKESICPMKNNNAYLKNKRDK